MGRPRINAAFCRTPITTGFSRIAAMHTSLLSNQTGHSHLKRLVLLRSWTILGQFAALILAHRLVSHDFPWLPMIAVPVSLIVLNGLTWWRLSLDYPVGNLELFLQLALDVAALTVLLYFSGGSTNPFVSLYLLPLVLAAASLPRRHTWAMAALTVTCYSLLMAWYVPLPNAAAGHGHDMAAMAEHAAPLPRGEAADPNYCRTEPASTAPVDLLARLNDAFSAHVLGMWLGFVISALVVAYFATAMAAAVRLRDAQLNRVREDTLRNERIVSLGILAASAAHELGTPLSTLSVVIGEMRSECRDAEQQANLSLLAEQVQNCKRILNRLVSQAQETPQTLPAEPFLAGVLDEWQLLRPTARYRYQAERMQPAPQLTVEPALRAALLNLLNNAADASPDPLDIRLRRHDGQVVLEILDHGPGLTPEAAAHAGAAFFSTKKEGRGLGLFLANATLERLGGSVRLYNRAGGGTTTEVVLPCHEETT